MCLVLILIVNSWIPQHVLQTYDVDFDHAKFVSILTFTISLNISWPSFDWTMLLLSV